MERDSVHASIEKKIKKVDIFTHQEWYGYIRTEKVNKPHYVLVQVKQDDFVSFKDLAHGNFSWQKLQVSNIQDITIDVNTPDTVAASRENSVSKQINISFS
ncbi:putative fimbrial-like protein YcbV [Frankliniella fusca]|uniref:Fimbrial-like protein YcbV n=1 Tax=Frankliniella fusca TaxID=407009 RepID=A0AAE1H695_9NEOP|nr:putative fimbrial-like protein YcbV [Frankliniella fusca]